MGMHLYKYKHILSNLAYFLFIVVIFFIFLFWGQIVSLKGQPEQPESLRAYHVSPPENQTLSNFTGRQYTAC